MSGSEDRRAPRALASFVLWLFNVGLGTAIGTSYLAFAPEGRSAGTAAFLLLALLSSVLTLALLPGGVFALTVWFVRSERLAGVVQALTGAAFLSLLYADTRVYSLLRYHMNGAVLNVFITPGSGDAVHLGGDVWWPVAGALLGMGGLQYAVWCVALRRAERRAGRVGPRREVLRPAFAVAVFLLSVVSIEKTLYAAAEIQQDRELTQASRVLPLYPRLPLSRFLDEAERPPALARLGELSRARAAEDLAYPLARPALDPAGPRPNVFFLVVDSWRQDAFDPTVTPRMARFAEGGRRYEDHVSGGNGTRFGVFSMLYGLHGSYWFPMLAARRSPVMLDALREAGYDCRVFSSASMNFPELRDTAWVGIEERVVDDHPSRFADERDVLLAEGFEAWLDGRAAAGEDAPFFAFVLLDSPHQPYSAPGGPFQPAAEELDYLELAKSAAPELVERVHNRYLNAVHHADGVAGRLLDALDRAGHADDTLIVLTGDHGEEFQECGYWGHTSNFTAQQLRVPLVLKGPGVQAGVERGPTSHVDLPATVLEMLGADPALRPAWTLGRDLLGPVDPERRRVAAGWSDLGVWTPHGILHVPLTPDAPYTSDVLDACWNSLGDPLPVLLLENRALEILAEECTRFLVPREISAASAGGRARPPRR